MNQHSENANRYIPPTSVKHDIIKHALRNIPGSKELHKYLDLNRSYNRLNGLKVPDYNWHGKGDGSLQFAFGN